MVMNVTLYKNSKVDNKSKMGYWRDNYSQQAYFNSLEKYSEDVKTVKLGDPLTVNLSVKEILDYNYGHIDYGDRFRYYFSIDDLRMVTETMTDVYYSIDCYETLVTQKPFRFGRANMTRQPTKPDKAILSIDPNVIKRAYTKSRYQYYIMSLVAVRWDSVNNRAERIIISTQQNDTKLFDGTWFSYYQISGTISEIIQCCVTSGQLVDTLDHPDISIISDFYSAHVEIPIENIFGNRNITIESGLIDGQVIPHSIEAISDNRGNIVFQCEYGKSYTLPNMLELCIGFDGIYFDIYLEDGKYVKIPLEPVSFMIDNWAEYSYRQRAIDKEMRNIQMNKQLIQDIGQSIANAGNTAAFGKMGMGGGGSGGMGAVAMVGGIVSAGVNYASNAYFSPQEQAQIDKSYKYANDMLANYGEFTYTECTNKKLQILAFKMDSDNANREDIKTNGYPTISAYESFTLTKGKWKGDVELLDINSQWARQIQERFINGVDVV